jgi:large subunit ribosomal protein L9
MDIILLQHIDKVGNKHEIVSVKPGYARNYLIPQGMAIIANEANKGKLDELRAKEAEVEAQKISEYQALAAKLASATIKIGAKAGTTGKIFGSVTNVQIAAAIKDQMDIELERRFIHIPEEVKELGSYKAEVHFHPEVHQEISIEVIND